MLDLYQRRIWQAEALQFRRLNGQLPCHDGPGFLAPQLEDLDALPPSTGKSLNSLALAGSEADRAGSVQKTVLVLRANTKYVALLYGGLESLHLEAQWLGVCSMNGDEVPFRHYHDVPNSCYSRRPRGL